MRFGGGSWWRNVGMNTSNRVSLFAWHLLFLRTLLRHALWTEPLAAGHSFEAQTQIVVPLVALVTSNHWRAVVLFLALRTDPYLFNWNFDKKFENF